MFNRTVCKATGTLYRVYLEAGPALSRHCFNPNMRQKIFDRSAHGFIAVRSGLERAVIE